MTLHTVKKAKKLWATWDIRVFMLVSLLIQTSLTMFAPYRKRSTSGILSFCMWLLYLCADAVAQFTIGLIASSEVDSHHKTELLAFWAPFLLLHLGGPDTIAALAMEDNELWHRHALQLVTQVGVTLYVFIQSFQHNNLWLPTLLMFVDGCIKYVERTCALYFASADAFRESLRTAPEPGSNYARLMEEYFAAATAQIPATIQGKNDLAEDSWSQLQLAGDGLEDHGLPKEVVANSTAIVADSSHVNEGKSNDITTDIVASHVVEEGDLDNISSVIAISEPEEGVNANADPVNVNPMNRKDSSRANRVIADSDEMIKDAYHFYNKFKVLLADAFLSLKDRKDSSDSFLIRPSLEAFRIIEIELNIIYDIFYTKAFLLQRKLVYPRLVSLLSVTASLVLFSLKDKSGYKHIDVFITFILLVGAIALDVCSVVVLILSDWWVIITSGCKSKWLQSLLWKLSNWSKWAVNPSQKRWSGSISQYNLLKRFFKDPPTIFKYIFIKRLQDILIGWLYVKYEQVDEQLIVKFIVDELQMKAKLVPDDSKAIKEVCSARGNLVLQDDLFLVSKYLNPWTVDVDFDESLLTWHLATNICYLTTKQDDSVASNTEAKYRQISKMLSDYMSYLLLRKQAMISPVVGMADIRFEDTRAEARKFMMNKRLDTWFEDIYKKAKNCLYKWLLETQWDYKSSSERDQELLEQFCASILEVKVHVRPIVAKGDKSKSVLFDACFLAQQLNMFGEQQWEITSKVWVELLCYAATRCAPRSHVAQLSKGGELITLVWLLMAHLGLGEHFLQNQGYGWTKLIIHK